MNLATVVARILEAYLLIGVGFAVWFASRGAARLDPIAGSGTVGFRLLLVPGATALWPYLLYRVVRGGPAPPEERTAHRLRAKSRL
jgi:hypothetical protein